MFVVSRFRVGPEDREAFVAAAETAVAVLAARRGCTAVTLGRNADDPDLWALHSQWESVGAYRRALSHYDVKLHVVPLLYQVLDEPSAYVRVLSAGPPAGPIAGPIGTAADGSAPLGAAASSPLGDLGARAPLTRHAPLIPDDPWAAPGGPRDE